MDPTQQQRGDFVAFLNRNKQPGDRRPMFEGRIAKPGSAAITAWYASKVAVTELNVPREKAVDPSVYLAAANYNYIDERILTMDTPEQERFITSEK